MENIIRIALAWLILMFSYNSYGAEAVSEKIKFQVEENLNLQGRLVAPPDKNKKYPAVLILEGSGKSPVKVRPDGDSFLILISRLSEQGIVGLHYNKRGSGENFDNGSYIGSSFKVHTNDALKAYNYLKNLHYVDESQIYVLGQSIGGHLGTQVAMKSDIAGLILYASPVRSLKVLFAEQNRLMLKYMGKTDAEINEYVNQLEADITNMENDSYVCKEPNCLIVDGYEAYEGAESVELLKDIANNNQLENFKSVLCPVLIINGTSDFIVSDVGGELSYNALSSHNNDITLEIIKGLDHFFAHNESKEESFKYVMDAQKNKKYKKLNENLWLKISSWLGQRVNN